MFFPWGGWWGGCSHHWPFSTIATPPPIFNDPPCKSLWALFFLLKVHATLNYRWRQQACNLSSFYFIFSKKKKEEEEKEKKIREEEEENKEKKLEYKIEKTKKKKNLLMRFFCFMDFWISLLKNIMLFWWCVLGKLEGPNVLFWWSIFGKLESKLLFNAKICFDQFFIVPLLK